MKHNTPDSSYPLPVLTITTKTNSEGKPMSLKIAMIATGRIAETQLAPAINLAEGAELWSVYSRDQGRAEAFAQQHGCKSKN